MSDMYTNIGHLFTSTPYRAEQSDTRQEIRRHDPEHERRRGKDQGDRQKSESDTEDHADVSVGALKAFLEGFVKSMNKVENPSSGSDDKQNEATKSDPNHDQAARTSAPMTRQRKSPQAAHAASIYQRTAQKTSGNAPYKNTSSSAASMGLEAADIRTIHLLIEQLGELSKRNVQNLRIERSDSFLNSLLNAVKTAMAEH